MLVKFAKQFRSYNAGEVADFPEHTAAALIDKGVATSAEKPRAVLDKVADAITKPIKRTVAKAD